MFVVITGNPSVGKSSIIDHLNQNNFLTYKVDDYVNEIYQKNRIGYELIKREFGKEFVNDKSVNKDLLSSLIIRDEDSSIKLKKLIWPLIRDNLKDLKKKNKDLIVEMAIYKIAPDYFADIFDFVIEVKRNHKDIIASRKNDLEKFYSSSKELNANFVISNYWTWEYTIFVVDQLFKIIK